MTFKAAGPRGLEAATVLGRVVEARGEVEVCRVDVEELLADISGLEGVVDRGTT